jgi:hypothetical protein
LAGYRRFIAYVYDYENGKKGSNCGFIKVEVKDQQCSVEVHLHCQGLPEDIGCKVYGFTRKDGLINGILLDNCETEKEVVECLITTDAMNMNSSGVSIGKMGGMIIVTDTGGFFGTEWDDQPIRPENFRELKPIPAAEKNAQSPDVPANETSKNSSASNMPNADLIIDRSSDMANSPATATIQEFSIPDEAADNAQTIVYNPNENNIEAAVPTVPSKNMEASLPDNISENTDTPTFTPHDESEQESASPIVSEKIKSQASVTPKPAATFSPFSDGELAAAWKIHLNDLKRFPRHYCALRNNRFIQYGHYNFGHLLLGQRNNGQYILGVPGGYNQQERFMANMFGFPYFKESNYVEIPKARGGYWYRLIDAPDSHR